MKTRWSKIYCGTYLGNLPKLTLYYARHHVRSISQPLGNWHGPTDFLFQKNALFCWLCYMYFFETLSVVGNPGGKEEQEISISRTVRDQRSNPCCDTLLCATSLRRGIFGILGHRVETQKRYPYSWGGNRAFHQKSKIRLFFTSSLFVSCLLVNEIILGVS